MDNNQKRRKRIIALKTHLEKAITKEEILNETPNIIKDKIIMAFAFNEGITPQKVQEYLKEIRTIIKLEEIQ